MREATTDEVKDLRAEKAALKETLAELFMENRVLKKSVLGDGEDGICEPPRVYRRLQILEDWSDEQIKSIFPRGQGTRSAHGVGA